MADAQVSKTCEAQTSCEFDSHPGHMASLENPNKHITPYVGMKYQFLEIHPITGAQILEKRIITNIPDPDDPYYVQSTQIGRNNGGGSRLDEFPIELIQD